MQYRTNKKTGDKVSILGFGCMRFTKDDKNEICIDLAREQIKAAVKAGVNYIDTAYVYRGSEKVTGQILFEEGLRDKVFLATKLPRWSVKKNEDMYRFFAEQKENLKTDHFDYYLIHNFNEFQDWEFLKTIGVLEFIEEKKRSGEIRRIGFSYHGGYDEFAKIIADYDWDFTQLQVNYLDEFNQAGVKGVELAKKHNISVIIMEPLRGGGLVDKLPKEVYELFDELNKLTGKKHSPAEWAFKWVWSIDNVLTALSGMNAISQVEENVVSASNFEPLTVLEKNKIKDIQKILDEKTKIMCTECSYCSNCPKGVDIPSVFRNYNDYFLLGEDEKIRSGYKRMIVDAGNGAEKCIKCGICETKCPQHIEIRKWLDEVNKWYSKSPK